MGENETERTGAPLIGLTTYHRNGDHKFDLPAEYVDAVRRWESKADLPEAVNALLSPEGCAAYLGYRIQPESARDASQG